jgi:MoaA/NifB/PqqE/SkfB family radical SAM enzyme
VKSRIEHFGAWVRIDAPPALVALDREGARKLGIDGGDAWTRDAKKSEPLEAHVAVTSKCNVGCEGCYLDARPDGAHVARETLERTLDALAARGVFTVAFGGGEPLMRDDLGELAESARARGLLPVVTTSGVGMTRDKARALGAFAQVNVSYDGEDEVYRAVRAFPGAPSAERAMDLLREANVAFGVNVVLTRQSLPALETTLARAQSHGAREAQLLRYKPAGRAAKLDYLVKRLTREQVDSLGPLVERIVCKMHPSGFRVRIDCAMVSLMSDVFLDRARELAALGVFGCEAGSALAAVRADGRDAPCSFLDPGELAPHGTHAPCDSCALRDVCRGGCRAVARFLTGRDGPDPECPRVVRHVQSSEQPTSTGSGTSVTPNRA